MWWTISVWNLMGHIQVTTLWSHVNNGDLVVSLESSALYCKSWGDFMSHGKVENWNVEAQKNWIVIIHITVHYHEVNLPQTLKQNGKLCNILKGLFHSNKLQYYNRDLSRIRLCAVFQVMGMHFYSCQGQFISCYVHKIGHKTITFNDIW